MNAKRKAYYGPGNLKMCIHNQEYLSTYFGKWTETVILISSVQPVSICYGALNTWEHHPDAFSARRDIEWNYKYLRCIHFVTDMTWFSRSTFRYHSYYSAYK